MVKPTQGVDLHRVMYSYHARWGKSEQVITCVNFAVKVSMLLAKASARNVGEERIHRQRIAQNVLLARRENMVLPKEQLTLQPAKIATRENTLLLLAHTSVWTHRLVLSSMPPL